MSVRFSDYKQSYRIVSLALDEETRDKLVNDGLEILYVTDSEVVLLSDNYKVSSEIHDIEQLREFNNYDVLEIWENGLVVRRYNDKSDDNYFFMTGSCNSNCIMCPSPEATRKNVPETNMINMMELVRHIPTDTPHLTITGGEPFLIGESIFPFIQLLKDRFPITEFLFLTNGRILAVEKYINEFVKCVPVNSIVAIPIHGSSDDAHDAITRATGSFKQTMRGISNLLKYGIRVEIRLVVSKLNVNDFDKIADLIISRFKGIEYVSIIAMEMTGNARVNQEQVWIPYKESFEMIADAIRKMIENGINVKLYNFPMCTVQRAFWTLCEKSISENKVRFDEGCNICKYKESCGGVFAGTFSLEKNELKAIV